MRKRFLLFLAVSFLFIPKVFAEDYGVDFQIMANDFIDGKITITADEPGKYVDEYGFAYDTETILQHFTSKYNKEDKYYFGYIDNDDYSIAHMCVYDEKNTECHDVHVEYTGVDQNIKAMVKNISKEIKSGHGRMEDTDYIYYTYDMGFINYILHGYKGYSTSLTLLNKMINYSPEYQKTINNKNISVLVDTRKGDIGAFYTFTGGTGSVIYDNVPYDYLSIVLTETDHLIYVPTDTDNTPEAYVIAAQKRIDDYVKNTKYDGKIKIEYAGHISDMPSDSKYDAFKYVDPFDGSVTYDYMSYTLETSYSSDDFYVIKYEGNEIYTLIKADSGKMLNPTKSTIDMITDVEVSTSSAEVPLDSEISVDVINEDSKEYRDKLNILNLLNAYIIDISLYSRQEFSNVSNISSEDFNVYFNIPDKLKGKKLFAYYVGNDGKIEKRAITINGNRGSFKTNHFSEYSIGEDPESASTNPKTCDNIIYYMLLSCFSIICLVGTKIYIRRLNK